LGDQPGGGELIARIHSLIARPSHGSSASAAAERASEGGAEVGCGETALPPVIDPRNELHLDLVAGLLLQRFREGDDTEAFSVLVELTRPHLHPIARQVVRQLAMALDPEDLVASFFARLFTDVRKQQPVVRRFLGLAHTAMRNDALNQLRQFKRAQARHVVWGRQSLFEKWADPSAQADDNEQAAVLRRLGTVFLCVVNQCFHELPERDRRVLLARELDGQSYDELAEALGLPRSQVGMILKRARQHLADRIGQCFAHRGGPGRAGARRRGAGPARGTAGQRHLQWVDEAHPPRDEP
jgi:RNA polymerase sigma-70 factor, ECF subfamily